jgi:RNA polymerase sigma factor (sigma-70 family)
MLLQLEGIGKQKIKYQDPMNVEFDNLSEYMTLAKKSISKFANKFYTGLSAKMLKDEEAIASITNAIIMADWRYNENHQGQDGKTKTKYSYRNQCALWAIQTYVTKNYKKNQKNKTYSLNYNSDEDCEETGTHIVDKRIKTPENILIEQESKQHVSSLINTILESDCITQRQSEYIKLYYFENNTYEQIGKKYDLTREAIRQSINKALSIIRGLSENQ